MAEAAVPGTEVNARAETVTNSLTNGEEDTQTIESTIASENDIHTADKEVKSDTDGEITEREKDGEPNEDAVNTSLTAEDEAHFRMLREAAESPPREATESARFLLVTFIANQGYVVFLQTICIQLFCQNSTLQTSESVLEQIAGHTLVSLLSGLFAFLLF